MSYNFVNDISAMNNNKWIRQFKKSKNIESVDELKIEDNFKNLKILKALNIVTWWAVSDNICRGIYQLSITTSWTD